MIAPGISTEMIPTTLSAGRRNPVDQLSLVGPQDKTEQSVLPGSDTKEVGTDLAGPVGPDVTVDQIQPVAEGPVGQYVTRRPVGPDGMFSTCDSDQPMADVPVGRFITHSPVGSDGMLSTCASDQPVADGPVDQSFILARWAIEGCFLRVNRISQWLLDQWASRLHPARRAHVGWYLTVNRWVG